MSACGCVYVLHMYVRMCVHIYWLMCQYLCNLPTYCMYVQFCSGGSQRKSSGKVQFCDGECHDCVCVYHHTCVTSDKVAAPALACVMAMSCVKAMSCKCQPDHIFEQNSSGRQQLWGVDSPCSQAVHRYNFPDSSCLMHGVALFTVH